MQKIFSNYARLFRITVGAGLLLWLAISFIAPTMSVYAELPPRPEAPTAPVASTTLSGAQIKLIVTDPAGGEWTEIEWQDPNTGDWHKVDGWRGSMIADGSTAVQVWWVDRDQFGDGPFRWLVYDAEGGELVATSENFETPKNNEQVITVTMAITDTTD